MNKILKILLCTLAFLIAPIIATGIIQFFLLIILGISMSVAGKLTIVFILYCINIILLVEGTLKEYLNK